MSEALMVMGYLMLPSSSLGIACLSTFLPVGMAVPGTGSLSCLFFLESGETRVLIFSSWLRKKAQTKLTLLLRVSSVKASLLNP